MCEKGIDLKIINTVRNVETISNKFKLCIVTLSAKYVVTIRAIYDIDIICFPLTWHSRYAYVLSYNTNNNNNIKIWLAN